MPIYAVVVTSGKEELVADIIANEAKKRKLEIYSIVQIPGVKGYIFIEALNSLEVQRAIIGIRHARKVMPQEVNIEELTKYFEEEKVELNIGDEATIELIDVPVPLQLNIPVNNLKLIEKSK